MTTALATAVFILNIEGTVHMGNIFKDMLDSFSSPSEPVKAEPKSKGLGAKSSMFIEDPGREAEKAEKSKTATGAATATVAKMYTDIVREQNKDDTGNTPIVSTTSVAYSSASDDARDISNQGYYPDKIIRDSMLSGKLSSATPRRNVTTEALDDIEAMIEKNRSKAVRNNRVYKAPIPSVETTYLDDYVDETERAISTEDEPASLSFYERYIAPTKTGLGVDPLRLANPPEGLQERLAETRRMIAINEPIGKGLYSNVDFDFIMAQEGFKKTAYVPRDKKDKSKAEGKSGVTIASGFDLGQRNIGDLKGLSTSLVNKLSPYLGLKKQDAIDAIKATPLTITLAEANDINAFAKKTELDRLIKRWDSTSNTKWDDLTKEQATAVASVGFQYGNLATETPLFWGFATDGDWDNVSKELRNFGDKYKSRRKREANYLEGTPKRIF